MPNIFILEGNEDGTIYRVVFHFPIPDVPNKAGISYRTLISQHENTTSVIPDLDSAIQTKLTNGELYEYVCSINRSPSIIENETELKNLYNELKHKVLKSLENKYIFYGKTLTV